MPIATKKSHLTRRQWEEFVRIAVKSADLSGEVLLRYQLGKARNRNPVRLKGRNDLVTGADLASCRLMKRTLKRFFPGHSFLTEEPSSRRTIVPISSGSSTRWMEQPFTTAACHFSAAS